MGWQPYPYLQKGETVGFVLALVPKVQVVVVFHSPDGFWYSSLHIDGRRVSQPVKAMNEADAKRRAVEGAQRFARALMAALDELETVGLEVEA